MTHGKTKRNGAQEDIDPSLPNWSKHIIKKLRKLSSFFVELRS